jgi:dephospho-CoA kinase
MKLLGLTGGIGMGKSVALAFLAEQGLPTADTDVLARQAVEPGQPALEEIRADFGPSVLDPAGQVRRSVLADLVFADASARRRLEAILHPRIRAAWKDRVETWKQGGHPACVVAIPLLFETNAQAEFDAIVCAACSEATQRQRLLSRGWNEVEIRRRIQSQWPVTDKISRSNYVLWTEGSLAAHREQLDRIMQSFQAGGRSV